MNVNWKTMSANLRMSLNVREAADEARVSVRTISNWVSSGKLPSQKIGGCRRILTEHLRVLLAGEQKEQSPAIENAMPTGFLIEHELIESLAGVDTVDTLIKLGRLRYAVGRLFLKDVRAIFQEAAR